MKKKIRYYIGYNQIHWRKLHSTAYKNIVIFETAEVENRTVAWGLSVIC